LGHEECRQWCLVSSNPHLVYGKQISIERERKKENERTGEGEVVLTDSSPRASVDNNKQKNRQTTLFMIGEKEGEREREREVQIQNEKVKVNGIIETPNAGFESRWVHATMATRFFIFKSEGGYDKKNKER
jgi:hypothetical protein